MVYGVETPGVCRVEGGVSNYKKEIYSSSHKTVKN